MRTINEIKANLTKEQQAVINAVWEYHITGNDRYAWPPPAVLFRKFTQPAAPRKSGRDFVLSAINSLNGSIIYEHQDHYYMLTFIGALLTDEGKDGIDLIACCLELFQKKHDAGLSLKDITISSKEVAESLNLSEEQLRLLYEIINLSYFVSAGGRASDWVMSVTYWRDEFLVEDDLRAYVEQETLKEYDEKTPIRGQEKAQYFYQKQHTITGAPAVRGNKIFIGHGRSRVWKDLKEFLQDRLNLEWDEFNRESVAGRSNKEVLSEKLDDAGFAFLVMTGEDQHADQSTHARENVIHEAGLFQGRLGFEKAIILLEEGCAEFSNVQGVSQIRFPKDNIGAKFEEIRQVLEREGILLINRSSPADYPFDSI
jgi:predicted nucleotide-binding protein